MAVRAKVVIWIGWFRGARRCDESQEGWKEGLDALEEAVTYRCEELKKESYGTLLKLPLLAAPRAASEAQSAQAPTVSNSRPTSSEIPAIRVIAGILVLCIILCLWAVHHARGLDIVSIAYFVGGSIAGTILTIYTLYGNRPFDRVGDLNVLSGYWPARSPDDPDLPLGRQGYITAWKEPQSCDVLRVLVFGQVGMRWWPPGHWLVVDGFSAKKDGSTEPLPLEVLDEYW